MSVRLSVRLPVRLSVSLSVCLSIWSVCLSVCLSHVLSFIHSPSLNPRPPSNRFRDRSVSISCITHFDTHLLSKYSIPDTLRESKCYLLYLSIIISGDGGKRVYFVCTLPNTVRQKRGTNHGSRLTVLMI